MHFRFIALLFCTVSAKAQLVPGAPPVLPAPGFVEPIEGSSAPRAAPVSEDGAVLADALRVIRLDSGKGAPMEVEAEGLEISADLEVPSAASLAKRLRKRLGRPLHEGDLAAIADEILDHFEKGGRPMVLIDAPQQDFRGGNLRFLVEIGRIGGVAVSSPKYGDGEAVSEGLSLRSGDPLLREAINRQLAWYGRNAFRTPRLFVSPGTAPATADLLIGLEERKPWRIMLGYENSAADILGGDQFVFGAAGMTKDEHILAYQAVMGESPSVLQAHALGWEIPFHSIQQALVIDVAYAEVGTSSSVGGLPVRNDGTSWSISAMQKFVLPPLGKWSQTLAAGVVLRSTDQFVLFGGGDVSPGVVRFLAGRITYTLHRKWDSGSLAINADLLASPGGLISGNDDSDFRKYDLRADSGYFIGRFGAQGWWSPGADWRVAVRGGGQLADSRLLASEQFAVGGHGTVRGISERAFLSDAGWHVSTELISPAIALPGGIRARFLGFVDHAGLSGRDGSSQSVSGAGFGIRAELSGRMRMRLDHGWSLDGEGSHTHVGVEFAF